MHILNRICWLQPINFLLPIGYTKSYRKDIFVNADKNIQHEERIKLDQNDLQTNI